MAGWRVGFCVGNPETIFALRRIKSYLDYGIFQPIQIAAIIALNGPQECVADICDVYRSRRDTLITGLNRAGWQVDSPKGTMFVWAKIPPDICPWDRWNFQNFSFGRLVWRYHPGWDSANMEMNTCALP